MKRGGRREGAGKGTFHDGFRIEGSDEGGYAFVEGRKPKHYLTDFLSRAEVKSINEAAKRRGIKGGFKYYIYEFGETPIQSVAGKTVERT
jgi:hypothetical protein